MITELEIGNQIDKLVTKKLRNTLLVLIKIPRGSTTTLKKDSSSSDQRRNLLCAEYTPILHYLVTIEYPVLIVVYIRSFRYI